MQGQVVEGKVWSEAENGEWDCWYPASRGYIFAVWAGVRKLASADNHSIFYHACVKFITRFASKINCQVCCQMMRVLREEKKLRQLLPATQDSQDALNQSRTGKSLFFLNIIFVQISGRIWSVVGRGYFSHASSHSENVASAHRVDCWLFYSLDLQQTLTLSKENLNIFGEDCACLCL